MYVSLYNGSGTLLFTYPNYSGSGVKQNLLTESQRRELLSRLKGDEDNEVCEIAATREEGKRAGRPGGGGVSFSTGGGGLCLRAGGCLVR